MVRRILDRFAPEERERRRRAKQEAQREWNEKVHQAREVIPQCKARKTALKVLEGMWPKLSPTDLTRLYTRAVSTPGVSIGYRKLCNQRREQITMLFLYGVRPSRIAADLGLARSTVSYYLSHSDHDADTRRRIEAQRRRGGQNATPRPESRDSEAESNSACDVGDASELAVASFLGDLKADGRLRACEIVRIGGRHRVDLNINTRTPAGLPIQLNLQVRTTETRNGSPTARVTRSNAKSYEPLDCDLFFAVDRIKQRIFVVNEERVWRNGHSVRCRPQEETSRQDPTVFMEALERALRRRDEEAKKQLMKKPAQHS